ncbi:Lipoxygenase [Dorcoceras hygrometricum]|uniref:Lipoxygenase n=1 Tax=Dorcoceras hygrometricum TaxID=472368 RepID=A0A2Z7CBT2_9LAMI|nr:Lipoxygenase [Dorcoceras hygrometricum]
MEKASKMNGLREYWFNVKAVGEAILPNPKIKGVSNRKRWNKAQGVLEQAKLAALSQLPKPGRKPYSVTNPVNQPGLYEEGVGFSVGNTSLNADNGAYQSRGHNSTIIPSRAGTRE